MRHPVDDKAWQEFDKRHHQFVGDVRNVRLGLAVDGFNPFGNMSSAYSMWHVVLTTYNLPPWICMKVEYLMLSLLIPRPQSPGKDMNIFFRPLIDELNELWVHGLETRDAAYKTVCLECVLRICGQSMIFRHKVVYLGGVVRVTERVLLVTRIHHPCG